MCRIQQLVIRQYRNISDENIDLGNDLHLFYGNNGAGKTSILEAIMVLASGKSWRSKQLSQLIKHNTEAFSLEATVLNNNRSSKLRFQKHASGQLTVTTADTPCSLSELARQLPTQLIGTHSYRLLTDGPKLRRSFFNWGLFHVEPSFHSSWQRWQKLLKQRNAALKRHSDPKEVHIWDKPLAELAHAIDEWRKLQHYDIKELFQTYLGKLNHPYQVDLSYQRGWPDDEPLSNALIRSFKRDSILGHTQLGPQKADFLITCNELPADQVLSQGQQKIAMVALHLAQVDYLKRHTGKSAIVLLDDLTAELDSNAQQILLKTLQSLEAQTFITCIDPSFLSELDVDFNGALHQVEAGQITIKMPENQAI